MLQSSGEHALYDLRSVFSELSSSLKDKASSSLFLKPYEAHLGLVHIQYVDFSEI
jgi:hypothetical protein